jgi:uncharacterized protein (DUF4415 family)
MKKTAAEPYRDIDFTHAKRGPVVPSESGKTKISIRLDHRVLDYFRRIVEQAGGGNYQTLINDALMAYIQQQSMLDAVRQAVREELRPVVEEAGLIGSRGVISSPLPHHPAGGSAPGGSGGHGALAPS